IRNLSNFTRKSGKACEKRSRSATSARSNWQLPVWSKNHIHLVLEPERELGRWVKWASSLMMRIRLMLWFLVMHLFTTLLDWVRIGRLSEPDKDLERLLLRQQLDILERHARQPRLSRAEKLTLTVVAVKLKAFTGRGLKPWRALIR